MAEKNNQPSTEVEEQSQNGKKYEVTKNPLEEKFGSMHFKKETKEKVRQVSHLSAFKKSLITGAMVRFYNQYIWDGKGEAKKSVNFSRFNEILKLLELTPEQEKDLLYEYKQKDKLFQNQSDNLIALFKFILPSDLNEYDTEQRSLALLEAINKAFFKEFGQRTTYTMSTAKGSDLTLLGEFDARLLGVNPRDSLKKVSESNTNAINKVFEKMIKTS